MPKHYLHTQQMPRNLLFVILLFHLHLFGSASAARGNPTSGTASEAEATRSQDTKPDISNKERKAAIQNLEFVIQDIDYPVINLNTITESEDEIVIELAADILFDFDQAKLKSSALTSLKSVAQRISNSARGEIRIEGHTDSKGSDSYNQNLSEKRARSVRDWLINRGELTAFQFVIKGFGETKPAVPNETENGEDDPSGRQRNRRVEIIINTKG